MKWTRAALLLTAHAAVACAPPPSSIGKPPSVVVTPATRIVSQPVGVASAETCVPRVAANGGAFFALDASERSKRVQAALRLKYREPEQSGAKDDPSERAEARPNFRFVFELLPKRWGAEGPVPWQELPLPRLQRFTEPLALYATELWTGEFEYPWVSVLVVAREAQDQLELNVVMSPDFSGDTQVIESLLLDACAGSANLRSQLALAVRELYALGGAQPGEETTQDGSCTVTDFHLYQDAWRYLAIDFSSSGRVRHVYAFNPMDEEDSLRRRTLCTEHAAEP